MTDEFGFEENHDVARERKQLSEVDKLGRVDLSIDEFFENLEIQCGFRKRLTGEEVTQLVGDEVDHNRNKKLTLSDALARASLRSLRDLDGLAKSDDPNLKKAFAVLQKRFEHSDTLAGAMKDCAALFDLDGDQKGLVEKAIASLDVALFLKLLSVAIARVV